MNINLFKKQKVVTIEYVHEHYVTQDEYKSFIKQINKKIDNKEDKKTKEIKGVTEKIITHKELHEKSESIIQNIHKHINDINQYNSTINAYLLKQLRDKIDEQDKLIEELYDMLESSYQHNIHGTDL